MTTVPVIIRNQRPRKWPTIAMRLCIFSSLASCTAAFVFAWSRVPEIFTSVMMISWMGSFAAAVCIAVYSLSDRPVDKLLLGNALEVWPGKHRFAIGDIHQIELVSRPEDDFGELTIAADVQAVQIVARGKRFVYRLRLVLNKLDTARLREWMTEKGIPTTGRDGPRGD